MTSPPSRGRGFSIWKTWGWTGDVVFGTDNVSAIGLEAPLGRGTWTHVHADLELCRGAPRYPPV